MSVYLLDKDHLWQLMPNGVPKGDFVRWQDPVGNEYVVPSTKKVYQLAFVGYGSSIAYYINALRQRSAEIPGFKWSRTVIIGNKDAWEATIRGEGFINHEVHNIAQWSDQVPRYTTKYLPRQDWVAQNSDVLAWAVKQGAHRTGGNLLRSVSRKGDLFALDVGGDAPVLAAKVILGMGAGPHFTFPYERYVPQPAPNVRQDSEAMEFLRSRIINLDRFMLMHPENAESDKEDLTVIIHGANAGIDAVQRAREHGYTVYLFRSEEPAWLSGNRLSVSPTKSRLQLDLPEDDDEENGVTEVKVSARNDKVTVSLGETKGKVQVDIEFKEESDQESSYEVDFYVPALGQNPMDTGAVGDVLSRGGLCWDDLEPIYDKDQIFGLPYQTVLGIQVKETTYGRGLQIIGAAAESLAAVRPDEARLLKGLGEATSVQHNYREQFAFTPPIKVNETLEERRVRESTVTYVDKHVTEAEDYLKLISVGLLLQHQVDPSKVPDLKKVFPNAQPRGLSTPLKPAGSAVASVLAAAQLGAVRAAAAALNNMIPDHIVKGGESNFTTDDRTMLAVYIASEFPHIPPKVAEAIVEQIVQGRRLPWKVKPEKGQLESTRIGYNESQSEQIKQWLRDENEAWWGPLSQARRTSEQAWQKLWDTASEIKVFNVEQ
ncbi:hypothetical protein [Pyxidicoccus caerfyrddinensis]|uniref:hypothetical protein n=1 Tax=Pyxidicoccus caerfyrddinensis TaxID=2709663 RepID=UPI0013D99781|nr:hypothetical protein [Pyxidicoccus caerfyrddinensis]